MVGVGITVELSEINVLPEIITSNIPEINYNNRAYLYSFEQTNYIISLCTSKPTKPQLKIIPDDFFNEII